MNLLNTVSSLYSNKVNFLGDKAIPKPKHLNENENSSRMESELQNVSKKTTPSLNKTPENKMFDENGKLNPVIKKFLDEKEFVFEVGNKTEAGTIKKLVQSCIFNQRDIDADYYHATRSRETADKIIREGFDKNFISRTKYGPGFYFTMGEGDARNYGSSVLSAHLKGKAAVMNKNWFSAIDNSSAKKAIGKFTNDSGSAEKVLNEYVRELLTDDLGYDFVYSSNGYSAGMVCMDSSKISNIRHF